ncbi:polysaccharide biosynthesis C-terminal domain-containing protein [bacterium]|nr:polysaccharide biosynthesis C-terminal domain-containing protein [bacterium]
MGIIQRDALRTMLISYFGLVLGYLNKAVLFIVILTTEEIGLINLILSVGMFFAQIAGLGTINTISRFSPFFRNSSKNNYGFLKLTVLIVGVGSIFASGLTYLIEDWVVTHYQKKSPDFVHYYYWIIPVGIANVYLLLFSWHLRAIFKNVLPVFINEIGTRMLVMILLFTLYFELISFEVFLILNCLLYIVPTFVLFGYLIYLGEIKSLRVKMNISRRFRGILLKFSLFSYMNTLGTVMITMLDVTMIALFIGLEGVGVYTTIIYLTSALQVPYSALLRIASPFVPVYWKERKMKEMEVLYKDVSSINLIIGCTLFLLVWVSRVDIFSLLPEGFQPGIWVFLFLMSGRLIDMYMGINSIILLTSKKYKIDIFFTVILLIQAFTLNYLLIPKYGIIGAAIATMAAVSIYNLFRMFYVWYQYKIHPFKSSHALVILLLFMTIVITEIIPSVSENFFMNGIVQSAEVLILFVIPIVYFKLEPQLNDYFDKVWLKLVKKKSDS